MLKKYRFWIHYIFAFFFQGELPVAQHIGEENDQELHIDMEQQVPLMNQLFTEADLPPDWNKYFAVDIANLCLMLVTSGFFFYRSLYMVNLEFFSLFEDIPYSPLFWRIIKVFVFSLLLCMAFFTVYFQLAFYTAYRYRGYMKMIRCVRRRLLGMFGNS